ncbi:hypothetical protein BHM03_00048751 [Ensete ventricosum]|nr:hypothetical protein BHM03_00048751 [Ensete ventricosum]
MPPSPPKLPFIGNLHQLGSLPHRSLHALSQKHGRLMLLHLGQMPTLVVSSPDAAREVMRTHDHVFASRPALKPAKVIHNDCKDLGFAPYGEHWRQLRKICTSHLLSSSRVQSYRVVREAAVAFMMRKISNSLAAPRTSVDMSEVLYSLSNDVLCRVVSGKFTSGEGRHMLLRELIDENSSLLAKFFVEDYIPWLGWLDVFSGFLARAKKNKEAWDDLLDEVIKEHGDRGDEEEKDFVSILLSLRKDPGMDTLLTPPNIKALLIVRFHLQSSFVPVPDLTVRSQ